jgi:hypothetical protein
MGRGQSSLFRVFAHSRGSFCGPILQERLADAAFLALPPRETGTGSGAEVPLHNPTSMRARCSLPGFVAASRLVGVFGDRYARVLVLRRRKKRPAARSVDTGAAVATASGPAVPATSRPAGFGSTSSSSAGGSTARGAAACT